MDETRKTEIGKMIEALRKVKKSPQPSSLEQDNGTIIITSPGTNQNETTTTLSSGIHPAEKGNAAGGKAMAEAFKAAAGLLNIKKFQDKSPYRRREPILFPVSSLFQT